MINQLKLQLYIVNIIQNTKWFYDIDYDPHNNSSVIILVTLFQKFIFYEIHGEL